MVCDDQGWSSARPDYSLKLTLFFLFKLEHTTLCHKGHRNVVVF